MKRRSTSGVSSNTADRGPPSLKPVPNPLLGSSNGADHGPTSQSHIESSLSEGTSSSSSSSSDSKKKHKARKKHRHKHKKKHSKPPKKVSRKDKDQKRLNKLLSKNKIVPFIFTGPKRMIPNRMEALPKLPPEIGIGVSSSKCNGNTKPSTSSELTSSKGSSPSDETQLHKTTSNKAAAAAGREAVERKESESAIDALLALGGRRTPMASNSADALKSDVGGTAKLE